MYKHLLCSVKNKQCKVNKLSFVCLIIDKNLNWKKHWKIVKTSYPKIGILNKMKYVWPLHIKNMIYFP